MPAVTEDASLAVSSVPLYCAPGLRSVTNTSEIYKVNIVLKIMLLRGMM